MSGGSVSPLRALALAALLASLPWGSTAQESGPTAPAAPPEIQVEVLEDAWAVGDEKTYTLLFDRAPFGRQAIRLVSLRRLPGDDREAVFQQRITLDLRALGQEGTLEHSGTIRYRLGEPGPYRYREGILSENGYSTYRKGSDYSSLMEVELDPGNGLYRISGRGEGEEQTGSLPSPARAILLDLLVMGHWERVFEARHRWPLGSSLPQELVIPSPLPRFDFHRPAAAPRPVSPEAVTARLEVQARERIEIFGAQVDAYRCRIEPHGLTLWVSPHGGVLRFQDGRGLSGALEP